MSSKKKIKMDLHDIQHFDDNDITTSEDELSDSDKKLLEKVRKKHEPGNFDSEDEVFALGNANDDDDEDDDDYDSLESDIERPAGDDDLPDDRAWGKKKKAYYNTDYVDQDYATTTQKDMDAAEAEEAEASKIQERLADQLDDADFGFDLLSAVAPPEKDEFEEKIKLDLSKLSKNQQLELFQKENPEFEPIVTDFKARLIEVKDIIIPTLNLIKEMKIPEDSSSIEFLKTKFQLSIIYCTNISFYLTLKARKISVASHPVIKRLAQFRELLNQLDEGQGNLLVEASKVLGAHRNGHPLYKVEDNVKIVSQVKKQKLKSQTEERGVEKRKKKVRICEPQSSDEDDINDNEAEMGVEMVGSKESKDEAENLNIPQYDSMKADEKRAITYEIAKNKGLMPYRKKEFRNPRVKHRIKYQKAKIRRKGAVREVRKELNKYSGEISGIKASVKKGIRLK